MVGGTEREIRGDGSVESCCECYCMCHVLRDDSANTAGKKRLISSV